MSERSDYESGAPCWVDLLSADVTLSVRFYREIFGWEAVFDPRPESGGYGRFTLGGGAVAGIGPGFGDGVSSNWNTCVAVDDVETVASEVSRAGGKIALEPVKVLGEGVMASFQDPSGALLTVWQAERPRGAAVAGVPGAFAWSELVTRDVEACVEFYRSVFGWESGRAGEPGGAPYVEWRLRGRPVAGMTEMGPGAGWETPHWRVCFAVADADAAARRVREAGGSVLAAPSPTPRGVRAVVADAQSVPFGVLAPAPCSVW